MVTFYEAKQLLCRILGGRNIEDNDDDITIELRPFREQHEKMQFVISNTELYELYNRVAAMNNNGLELYTGNHYEIAIDLNHPIIRRQEFPVISEDSII